MRKTDITKKMAEQQGVTRAEAADQLDRVVADIIRNLQHGERAQLPGLGEFEPGPGRQFDFNDKDSSRGK